MNNIPDVLGMNIPAAAKILDAAGISHTEEILKPVKRGSEDLGNAQMRVIRQINGEDGIVKLSVCAVSDDYSEPRS